MERNTADFTTTLVVDQSPHEVFQAVTNVRGWWSKDIVGKTANLGDEFSFEVKGVHRSEQRLVEVIPDQKVVWLVTKANLSFLKNAGEWTGTRVVFDIARYNRVTRLTFRHEGLLPSSECYGACSPAWTQYIQNSLMKLITTGTGNPNLEGSVMEGTKLLTENFTMSVWLDQTPRQVFDAVRNVRGWWSQNLEGPSVHKGDEFIYRAGDVHHCTIRVTKVVAERTIVWEVVDNYFSFETGPNEWKGTSIRFDISTEGDKTRLDFTHEGLVPRFECYDICAKSWGDYVGKSLLGLITNGVGSPNPKEESTPVTI